MAQDNVLIVFAFVVTVAILMQAGAMVGMWLALRRIPGQIDQIRADVKHQVDPLTQTITELAVNTREPLRTITTNLAEMSQSLRERSTQVDGVVEDLLDKSRQQIIRVDQMMSNLVDKVEATTDKVQQSVLIPINEFAAVIKGLQSGLDFLFSRRRPPGASEATTQDEQLFI